MDKKLYTWLRYFLGLSAVSLLFQSVIQFLLGPQLFSLDLFGVWFLVVNATTVVASILLLRYFYSQKYRFVFFTGVLSTACNICYALVLYTILEFHELANYHAPLLYLSIGASILCALSLLFLPGKNKGWLKAAGGLTLILGSLLLLKTMSLWVSFASFLVPVLYMLHFFGERKKTGRSDPDMGRKAVNSLTGTAWIILFALTVVFDLLLASECYTSIHWSDYGYQKTKEMAQSFDADVFVNSKGTLHYRLLKPLDYDPVKKYPIVVCLPYGGIPATDTIRQIQGAVAAELLAEDWNKRKYPAFIFIPNRPPGAAWGGLPYPVTVDSLVFDALVALDQQFSIDVKRRYVAGLSLGAFGTWNFICKRPDLFAAAIPVAGGGDPRLAPKIVNVAVWAFHGAKDKNVPVIRSREMIAAIKSAGGHPNYTEFPDEGHNIWDLVRASPGLLDWLFAQHQK